MRANFPVTGAAGAGDPARGKQVAKACRLQLFCYIRH